MISESPLKLQPGDALIIVDLQNDFLPGGALPVPRGNEVVPVIQGYVDLFEEENLPIFATRDWHPPDHCSFKKQGGIWPAHCVRGTVGSEFPSGLHLSPGTVIVSKADAPDQEAYSGFEGTNLNTRLKHAGVQRLFIGGLATDYCVLNTVKDALKEGFSVYLMEDAIQAVNLKEQDGPEAIAEMERLGSRRCTLKDLQPPAPSTGALLTDLYQLTMLQAYYDQGMTDTAVFEFYVRRLPTRRGFLLAAGLEPLLQFLENLRFSAQELEWLVHCGHLQPGFVDSLRKFRFTGDVHALPEGTVFFQNEPVIRITAPLPQAQLIETRLINLIQMHTLVASKAARMVLAAPGKRLIDFGFRRSHGSEAGLSAARAAYIAGFTGTATVEAGRQFGIPLFGTMAHSFIQSHDDEFQAFKNFAYSHPENVVLLLDTYDVMEAARKAVKLAENLRGRGISIKAVRLDSGDLIAQARAVRDILDRAGLKEVRILASGDLDEEALKQFTAANAPVDGFGIGTRLTTSIDAPALECVYKLQEYAGKPRRKRSDRKATLPGRKQIFRQLDSDGRMIRDSVGLEEESLQGEKLLQQAMVSGCRVQPPESLDRIRERAAEQLLRLPDHLRALEVLPEFPVAPSTALLDLERRVDGRIYP